MNIKAAMIFAAGMGTRLKPFTDSHPKALAEVNGITLLERNITYLKSFGIEDIVINTHHFSEQIHSFIFEKDFFGCGIMVSHEIDAPLETGGGLVFAKHYLQHYDNFVVMNVDILTNLDLSQMMAYHTKEKALSTVAVTNRESSRKFLMDENMQLSGWLNKNTSDVVLVEEGRTLKEMAFSGVHIMSNKIFDLLPSDGKFSIVDPYLKLAKNHTIKGFDHSGDVLIDVGKPQAIIEAEKYFN
jgi:N-acetyl-alpha-D-muramate 1-phosphate uridylyltransferase